MGVVRNDFLTGKMDRDTDERIVKGYRHAENVLIINSEGSDVGSVQNSYSNKKLTNYDFGENAKCGLGFADEKNDKIYWFVISDNGCYLVEWDHINEILSIVLGDTRVGSARVLDLKESNLITGIEKIISEDGENDMLGWCDDNIEPCCINIERAKTYGINGFEKEDIYLIKKPPVYPPTVEPVLSNSGSNNIEEKFPLFAYRWRYLDGEYSALSSFSNYFFYPKEFKMNYAASENSGMVNIYNSARIGFNTGDKRVVEIQVIVKQSLSNNLYVIETFNKANLAYGDNQMKYVNFSNDKIHKILAEKELYRTFDNVPRLAKAMCLIGNRFVFGNYVDGYDLIDRNGTQINFDYNVYLKSIPFDNPQIFFAEINENEVTFSNPDNILLKKGNKLTLFINILLENNTLVFNDTFYYILPDDYATLDDAFATDEFQNFFDIIKLIFANNYTYDYDPNWVVEIPPVLSLDLSGPNLRFIVSPVTYKDTTDDSLHVVDFVFETTTLGLTEITNNTSYKSNRDYTVGFIYKDRFGRETTVLNAIDNTIYIPQKYSTYLNKIGIKINHYPPEWAETYKISIKSKQLSYHVVYINKFYNEDDFVWAKLEGDNKQKVKEGDVLILKKSAIGTEPFIKKVKVLEIKEKLKDFLEGNNDANGNPLIEEAGLYMKIRPEGFSMDLDDYRVYTSDAYKGTTSGTPTVYLDLFSTENDTPPPAFLDLAIPLGSEIDLSFSNSREYDSGWKQTGVSNRYYAQRNYNNLEDFFNEIVLNRPLFSNTGNDSQNWEDKISIGRYVITDSGAPFHFKTYTEDPNGQYLLKIDGFYQGRDDSGFGNGKSSRLNAKITIRTNAGFFAFETEEVDYENELYFQTEQTFDIVDGYHQGNITNQDAVTNGEILLNSFNCFSFGNGVESYIIKDAFNKNKLHIDSRPSSTSIERYKEIRRYADLTYGEGFIESTNVNGLNEFNLSTANYKELDKQYGSIQKLVSRDGDIVVFQEEKTSKVMFGKDALYNGDGTANVTSIPEVLGQQVFYLGENGIGKNPESVGINDYQIFYTNALRGIVQRLSIDGVTDIVNGLTDYFRDLFILKPRSKKIGAFDPYHKQFFISVGEEPVRQYLLKCGNTISRTDQTTSFSYNLQLNDLEGDIVLNYNATLGNITITAIHDGDISVASNVTGIGNITIPRTNLADNNVNVTITPVSSIVSYEISNVCPIGLPLEIISIVVNDETDLGLTIKNRYKWGSSPYYYTEDSVFDDEELSFFSSEIGTEGIGKFPRSGNIVNIQSYKDSESTANFTPAEENRLGYLVTEDVYTELDIETILSLATFISTTEEIEGLTNIKNHGNFLFTRTLPGEKLYLIWDYTNKIPPVAVDDTMTLAKGATAIKNVLLNDTVNSDTAIITITTPPVNGTASVTLSNTIQYEHDDSATTTDSLVYELDNGYGTDTATLDITILEEPIASFITQLAEVVDGCSSEWQIEITPDQNVTVDIYQTFESVGMWKDITTIYPSTTIVETVMLYDPISSGNTKKYAFGIDAASFGIDPYTSYITVDIKDIDNELIETMNFYRVHNNANC